MSTLTRAPAERRWSRGLAVVSFVTLAACTGQIQDTPAAAGNSGTAVGGSGSPTNGGTGGSVMGNPSTGFGGATTSVGGAGAGMSSDPNPTQSPSQTAQACAAANGVVNAGLTRLRRMTRDQYNNTVRDLLGTTGTPADALAPDERMGPFASNAIAPITELLVQQHQEVAASLAKSAQARMSQLSPCDLAGSDAACPTTFVKDFGLKAFRRPLLAEEVTDYTSLFTLGKQGGGAQNGFRLVVEAMLQSPFFLYHHDVGSGGTPQPNAVGVTPYELASRLSYFLWNSMPDAPLFAAAADGSLSQSATISAQVTRMLNDPKAGATIALFHRQWLAIEDLPSQGKDATLFPSYDDALVDAMLKENALFSDYIVRRGDGLLKTLLTSTISFPQGGLFDLYGVAQPSGFSVGSQLQLNPNERAGILTQAAFLARNAHRDQSSPVHRGIIVRENLLCQSIPPPPANVNSAPPPPSAATSTR